MAKTTKIPEQEHEKNEEVETQLGDFKEDFANDVKAQEEELKIMNRIEEIDE